MKNVLLLLSFFVFVKSVLHSENIIDQNLIEKFVEIEFKNNSLQSVVFGIKKGETETIGCLGNSMTTVPATTNMHFRAGGVTINFLITIMLQLVDENKVRLDDTLSNWYPDYPKSEEVTLRMLADCTAGYFDYIHVDKFVKTFDKNVFKEWTAHELIDLAMNEPMLFEPGKGWAYSHTNFVIIGNILEKVTGKNIATLMNERIAKPLDLNGTSLAKTPQMPNPILHAFTTERGVYEDSTFWNPSWTSYSGLLISTIEDMLVWTSAFGQGRMFSDTSMEAMISPKTVGLGNNTENKFYGMGIGVMNGWLVQNPRFGGYYCFMAHMPSEYLSIFVVSTGTMETPPEINPSEVIASKLMKALLVPQNQ